MAATDNTTTAQEWANQTLNITLLSLSMSLSILGCLIIFITYLLFTDIRTSSRYIIICITISDLITVVSNWSGILMKPTKKSTLNCTIQSFFGTTAVLCSFLWTTMLAVFLYVTLVKENHQLAVKLLFPWFHVICWGIPILINVVAVSTGYLGNNSDSTTAGWCWIKVDRATINFRWSVLWMFLDGKLIEILAYFVVLVLYIKIRIHLRRKICIFSNVRGAASYLTQRTVEAAKNADKKLIFIPVVFILLRIWGTIRFFLYVSRGGLKDSTKDEGILDKVLLILHAIGDNSQGFANCILFCLLTPKVCRHLQQIFKHCCWSCFPRCYHDETETYSEDITDNQDERSYNEKSGLLKNPH